MHREDQFILEFIVRNGPAALDFCKSVFGAEDQQFASLNLCPQASPPGITSRAAGAK